jgi:predicted ATP-grasp superfamily ATP-dependent carboligase
MRFARLLVPRGSRATGGSGDATGRVLLTDGQERWIVAASRSLARAGFKVTVAADSTPAVAHWSRFCSGRVLVPAPQSDPSTFVATLEAELRAKSYALLVAGGDASLQVISEHRERLEPLLSAKLGLPSREAVAASADKLRLAEAAAAAGLRSPATTYCSSQEDAARAARAVRYPVIVKPRSSVFDRAGATVRERSRMARDELELRSFTRLFGNTCLVQPVEHGTVYSCAGVYAGGRLLALALIRYLRTWPPEAGNASFAETVGVPQGLAERICALLEAVGWQGIFEVELLRLAGGEFAVLDLNPRMYGSIALAIRAGADLPAVWCRWLLGRRPEYQLARPRVRYRWEDAELRRVGWELRHGQGRAALSVLRPCRQTVHPHFSWDDPGPIVARSLYLLRRAARSHSAG